MKRPPSPMRRARYNTTLAILALLVSQWLLLTHVHQQSLSSTDEICWSCMHAQHDGNAIPVVVPTLAVVMADLPLVLWWVITRRPNAVSRHYNPRAPPLL